MAVPDLCIYRVCVLLIRLSEASLLLIVVVVNCPIYKYIHSYYVHAHVYVYSRAWPGERGLLVLLWLYRVV